VPTPPPPPPPDLDAVRRETILRSLRANAAPRYEERAREPSLDLLARLAPGDAELVRQRLDDETRAEWDAAPPWTRDHLQLIFAVHHRVEPVVRRTGLSTATPPDDVHAMARGPLAAGGDFWIADLVATAALEAGAALGDGARVLDFGCSSGRHLRVLQAWRPAVRWMGCDPNEGAVRWAAGHLDGIEFFASPLQPPLDLAADSLDAVFAVSVWSHFGTGAAERWLAEMARLVRPGGALVLTVQGLGSLAHYLQRGRIDEDAAARAAEELLARGHAWMEAFGPQGDWGVKDPEWGMAYMTLEWLAERTLGEWTLERFDPRRIHDNQDLVVLRRR